MKKIEVKICTGTACYVLGGCDLLPVANHLPDAIKPYVKISGVLCLDLCRDNKSQTQPLKPPFVTINERVYSPQSLSNFVDLIQKEVDDD